MRLKSLECGLNMTSNGYSCELTVEEEYERKVKKRICCRTESEYQSLSEQEMTTKCLKQVYPKKFFDRFGDDLTELILSYLTFEDKIRLECVSKQWRRLVFNKQFELNITAKNTLFKEIGTGYTLKRQSLKSVLKKCPNISRVRLPKGTIDEWLEVITKYCRRITKLEIPYCCNETQLMSFATKHGMWLQEFGIDKFTGKLPNYMKKFLLMCPNIKKIDIYHSVDRLSEIIESGALMKLQVINRLSVRDNESHILKLLVNKYGTSLKGLQINIDCMSSKETKTCFAHISRFESLESLEIKFYHKLSKRSIKKYLKLLGKKCTKLREFRLKSTTCFKFKRFFSALSEFRSLETLVIDLRGMRGKLKGSVECLKHMTRLKHLSINCRELTEDFFTKIHIFLPNIRYLEINGKYFVDESRLKLLLKSFQTMKSIERVVYNYIAYYYCKNRSDSKPRILLWP